MAECRREQHLADAAKLLTVSSPAAAAYLRASVGYSSDSSSQRVCNGCGNLLVSGWSCEDVKPYKKASQKRSRDDATRKKVQCGRCSSITFVRRKTKPHIEKLKPQPAPKAKTRTANPPALQSTPAEKPVDAAKPVEMLSQDATSRKKRTRSKQSSLQSLLQHQKTNPAPNTKTGFSLDDFIKR